MRVVPHRHTCKKIKIMKQEERDKKIEENSKNFSVEVKTIPQIQHIKKKNVSKYGYKRPRRVCVVLSYSRKPGYIINVNLNHSLPTPASLHHTLPTPASLHHSMPIPQPENTTVCLHHGMLTPQPAYTTECLQQSAYTTDCLHHSLPKPQVTYTTECLNE